ncbi:MAG: hypothetical protein A2252_05545 [Elusimicrobia bacterium RIFOXYA2_FULL_39_19]|nr:MAG: hypothetical protein A2252_05545 [Elusimicrobia bacterium RIFOXYA2_FULL_39_19]
MDVFNRQDTKESRKSLRKNQTDAEKILWSKLRNKQLNGYKFFRQYGIDKYIVDFYCPKLKLAVEVDGGQHYNKEAIDYDKRRSIFLESKSIKTVRFTNIDILKNIQGVFVKIIEEIALIKGELP